MKRGFLSFAIIVIALLLLTGQPTPASAGTDVWTTNSLYNFGISSLAFDPQATGVMYVGTPRGIARSLDGGITWAALRLPALSSYASRAVGAIAIDPKSRETIYAASDGLFRSTNGGKTWTALGSGMLTNPYSIMIDNNDPRIVYVGSANGFFRTSDGGASWASAGLPVQGPAGILIINPKSPSIVYATIQQQGFFKSKDSGMSWVASNNGLPAGISDVHLVIDPRDPQTLYLSSRDQHLYKTTDGGDHWSTESPPREYYAITGITGDASAGSVLLATDRGAVFRSNDGGKTWQERPTGSPGEISFVQNDPRATNVFYVAEGGDLVKTTDGGNTWVPLWINAQWTAVGANPMQPGTIFAGDVENHIIRSKDGGRTSQPINFVGYATAFGFDPKQPNRVYMATNLAGARSARPTAAIALTVPTQSIDKQPVPTLQPTAPPPPTVPIATQSLYRSDDGGNTWTSTGLPNNAQVAVILVDPRDANAIYVGGETGFLKSTNAGQTWSGVNVSLTGRVTSIALDAQNPATIYLASVQGIYKSTDSGAQWKQLKATASSYYPSGSPVIATGGNPTRILLEDANGLSVSADGGATWQIQLTRSSQNQSVNQVVVDPKDPNRIYIASGADVFTSPDGGLSWAQLSEGLGVQSISYLAIDNGNPATLYLKGDAGGVWTYTVQNPPVAPTATSSITPFRQQASGVPTTSSSRGTPTSVAQIAPQPTVAPDFPSENTTTPSVSEDNTMMIVVLGGLGVLALLVIVGTVGAMRYILRQPAGGTNKSECPRCGTVNPKGSRFCLNCGQTLGH